MYNIQYTDKLSYWVLGIAAPLFMSVFLTRLSIKVARKKKILAYPNERSSHKKPTPRIGGVGLVLTFLIFTLILKPFPRDYPVISRMMIALFIGGILAFVLGLMDDVKNIPAIVKLIGQMLVSAVPLIMGLYIRRVFILGIGILDFDYLGIPLTYVWILFFINAFNFMDGMDGKAGSFTLIVSLSILIFILLTYNLTIEDYALGYLAMPVLLLIAVIIGFLVYNYPPAKTFLGDCGSQFLGYVLAVFAVYFSELFIAFIILLLPFIYDVLYTLFRRWRLGENLLVAHRSHLYQRLMIAGYSHQQVLYICIPTYFICAGCFLLYTLSVSTAIKALSVLLSLSTMIIYTLYTIHIEHRAKNKG